MASLLADADAFVVFFPRMRRVCAIAVVLEAFVGGSWRSAHAQLPSVPGYEVSTYATVTDPVRLSFDHTTGALYVGRDNFGSGGTNAQAVRIHRVGPGGAPVEEYGAMAILDPDAVVFDAVGTASEGAAGSVIVGGVTGADAQLVAVRPDQTVEVIDGPTAVYDNPTDFAVDGTGRVLMTDARTNSTGQVLVVPEGGPPTPLITMPGATALWLAVDAQDRIYVSDNTGTVQQFDANGVLLDADYVTGLGTQGATLAVGPGGPFGTSLYVIDRDDDQLVRVDAPGVVTPIGSGFGNVSDLEFGPDGALYVSQFDLDRIVRIDAPFSSEWQAASGLTPDLVCPPWTLTDLAAPEDPVLAGGQLTISTDAFTENVFYVQNGPNVTIPDPLIVEARVRLVSGAVESIRTGPISIALTTAPEVGVIFFAEADRIFLAASGTSEGDSAVVDTDDTPHTYRLVVDGTGAVQVFYDGVLTLAGATYQGASDHGPLPRVLWGEGSSGSLGTSEWEFVRNNAAVCVPTTTTTTTTSTSSITSTVPTTSSTSTSTTVTSTTTSSSSTSLPPTTTSTTLPPNGCDATPTFSGILCRVDALRARVLAEPGLGSFQPKLAKKLEKAFSNTEMARDVCADADLKKARKRLRKAAKALSQYVHKLGSLAARKKLDPTLREEFRAAGEAIATDVTTLRDAVVCPGDASA